MVKNKEDKDPSLNLKEGQNLASSNKALYRVQIDKDPCPLGKKKQARDQAAVMIKVWPG